MKPRRYGLVGVMLLALEIRSTPTGRCVGYPALYDTGRKRAGIRRLHGEIEGRVFICKDGVKRADVDSVFANPRGSHCQGYRPVKSKKNPKNLV